MTENDSPHPTDPQKDRVPLTLSAPSGAKKRTDVQVLQSFSHGRAKAVTVQVKRKRTTPEGETEGLEGPASPSRLTSKEQDVRLKAVKEAMVQAAHESQRAEQHALEEKQLEEKRLEEQRAQREQDPEASPKAHHESPPKGPMSLDPSLLDDGVGAQGREDLKSRPSSRSDGVLRQDLRKKSEIGSVAPGALRKADQEDDEKSREGRKRSVAKTDSRKTTPFPQRDGTSRTHLVRLYTTSDSEEALQREYRTLGKKKKQKGVTAPPSTKIFREVILPPTITVQELASRMSEKGADVIKSLLKMGVMATLNQTLDADTAELVVQEMGHASLRVSEDAEEMALLKTPEDAPESLLPRAPVVTIMGHVDHGKTSLLDALRKTDVVSGEAGGITQHIGAYQITLLGGKITFIDTPGHAAFTEMRARGANITDLVVLVVAADDGVKEQTAEAIRHARAAGVPLIVAINKMDKPGANPDTVRTMLLNYEVVVESLGGDVLDMPISARTGLNIDKLEELILLQAEVLNLRASPHKRAAGTVVESRLEKGRGPVATVLVQEGTLRVGDVFVSGCTWGRVRALLDDHGAKKEEALPSQPVEVLGFLTTPSAGDDFVVMQEESDARQIADIRERRKREAANAIHKPALTLENFASVQKQEGQLKELSLILRADVQGSLEAIQGSLEKMATDEVRTRILFAGVGGITESDINLAKASQALVIGFNVRANAQAREAASREGIELRYYSIIYQLIDEVKAALSGLLSPLIKENFLGNAEVRQVFNITKVGRIAGCYVTNGVVRRGGRVRLLRDDVVIYEGALKTLKRLKDEVREVRESYECGIAFEGYQDIREKDVIECFELESIQRTL